MKTKLVICMAACLAGTMLSKLKAQATDTTLKGKYERETIMLEGTRDEYIKNNEWKKIGVFHEKLEKEFETSSSETKQEVHAFRKQRRRGTVLLIAGGTVFLAAAFVAPVIAIPVFIGTFSAGAGTYFVGAFDLNKSRRHLNKAVWLHNRDLLVSK